LQAWRYIAARSRSARSFSRMPALRSAEALQTPSHRSVHGFHANPSQCRSSTSNAHAEQVHIVPDFDRLPERANHVDLT
jgi:hypothetical protein